MDITNRFYIVSYRIQYGKPIFLLSATEIDNMSQKLLKVLIKKENNKTLMFSIGNYRIFSIPTGKCPKLI
jgi:hypothetical protein